VSNVPGVHRDEIEFNLLTLVLAVCIRVLSSCAAVLHGYTGRVDSTHPLNFSIEFGHKQITL